MDRSITKAKSTNKNYREKLKQITTFIIDFDGVLSDGKVWVGLDGEQVRATNVKDGYAMHYALKKGYKIAIISGGLGESMRLRYRNFPNMEIFCGIGNKVETFNQYISKYQIDPEQIVYIGDDIPDYPVMLLCGIKACPADACQEIKSIADYISFQKGGEGCVREIIEQTLKAQQRWFENDASIW